MIWNAGYFDHDDNGDSDPLGVINDIRYSMILDGNHNDSGDHHTYSII